MHGLSLCRAIDLTVLDGYNALMKELDKLFDLKGELCAGHLWEIVYIDNEGDMMLVGNDPWPEFCNMVKKLILCSKEEVKKMKSTNDSSKGV
ncbi:unnamed protein product [Microthlaspi erraticum]|uniref:Auxin-responsive protein n=1 Tax=Microthlaspi erraticum TaxID=1685480 RepID=A0A6D2J8G4_9BRAS|nr:unnamed protein product [Microthlaspi erraticum]